MKKDNRGLTLVELIIAITILGVIVAPLLRAFVTAARVNAQARRNLNAVAVGEDIMEGLKAYSVDEISDQFNASAPFKIIDPGIVTGTYERLTALETTPDEKCFVIRNIQLAAGATDYQAVDAIVKLNTANYKTVSGDITDEKTLYNSFGMALLPVTGVSGNAICVQKKSVDEEMEDMLLAGDKLSRTITIDISNDGTKDNIEISYDYSTGVSREMPVEKSDEDIKDIYLFYYPIYDAEPIDGNNLVINNQIQGRDISLHLIKQNRDGTQEMSYKLKAEVNDENSSCDPFRIITNEEQLDTGTNLTSKNHGIKIIDKLYEEKSADRFFDATVTLYRRDKGRNLDSGTITEEDKVYEISGSTAE